MRTPRETKPRRCRGTLPAFILGSTSLDLVLKAQQTAELGRLVTQSDCTLILVTHEPDDSHALCSQVAVLGDGRVQESGGWGEILAQSRSASAAVQGPPKGQQCRSSLGVHAAVVPYGPSIPLENAMRWITRARPKVDRVACPWVVARFVDDEPEFLFEALTHDGELCSFAIAILDDELYWKHSVSDLLVLRLRQP